MINSFRAWWFSLSPTTKFLILLGYYVFVITPSQFFNLHWISVIFMLPFIGFIIIFWKEITK